MLVRLIWSSFLSHPSPPNFCLDPSPFRSPYVSSQSTLSVTSHYLETLWKWQRQLYNEVSLANLQAFCVMCQMLHVLILLWVLEDGISALWKQISKDCMRKELPSASWGQCDSEKRMWSVKSEKPEFCHLVVIGEGAIYLLSLGLGFLTCQVGITTHSGSAAYFT